MNSRLQLGAEEKTCEASVNGPAGILAWCGRKDECKYGVLIITEGLQLQNGVYSLFQLSADAVVLISYTILEP